jgi:hypothetical protein
LVEYVIKKRSLLHDFGAAFRHDMFLQRGCRRGCLRTEGDRDEIQVDEDEQREEEHPSGVGVVTRKDWSALITLHIDFATGTRPLRTFEGGKKTDAFTI